MHDVVFLFEPLSHDQTMMGTMIVKDEHRRSRILDERVQFNLEKVQKIFLVGRLG